MAPHYGLRRTNPPTAHKGAVPDGAPSATAMVASILAVLIVVAAVIYEVSKTVATLFVNTNTSAPRASGDPAAP